MFAYILFFSHMFFVNNCDGINITGYHKWTYWTGPDLYCPDWCESARHPDRCCACNALPCLDFPNVNISSNCGISKGSLMTEYLDFFGSTSVVSITNADVYELITRNGRMTRFPTNICQFSKSLITIDFTNNRISDLAPLKCLTELETIILDYNVITEVDNMTFSSMRNLRTLSMRGNKIGKLPPFALSVGDRNILSVDLSYNYLDTVDITNIIRPGVFCNASMNHASIQEITNELNYVVDTSVTHGPGYTYMENASISQFINFSTVGLDYNQGLTQIVRGQFNVDSSSLRCDCNIYPLLTSLGKEAGQFWPNVDNRFICNWPERMKGRSLTDLLIKEEFHLLVCELENCPHFGKCHCLDMPDSNKIVVNCTGAGLTEFPNEMPVGYWNNRNIELILVDNNIQEIPNRYYMDRLVGLDLRNNLISQTDQTAIENIVCPINMEDQMLSNLVSEFVDKDPNVINFGTDPVTCDCENLWIGDWIRINNAFGRLYCQVPSGEVLAAEEVTGELLECSEVVIPIATIVIPSVVLISLIILVATLCFLFRFDIRILLRRVWRSNSFTDMELDVFISFCEDDDDAFHLVRCYIRNGLNDAGYRTITPWFDLVLTGDRDQAIAPAIQKAHRYVIVVSSGYLHDYNSAYEFELIWKNFLKNESTQTIVINIDYVKSGDIPDRRLRAFRRAGAELSFREREDTLLNRLKAKLGQPLFREEEMETELDENDLEDSGNNTELTNAATNKDNHRPKYESLWDRLSRPETSKCNCKYRKCYLHSD